MFGYVCAKQREGFDSGVDLYPSSMRAKCREVQPSPPRNLELGNADVQGSLNGDEPIAPQDKCSIVPTWNQSWHIRDKTQNQAQSLLILIFPVVHKQGQTILTQGVATLY